jgi:[protein-PII] uridylyltransferase
MSGDGDPAGPIAALKADLAALDGEPLFRPEGASAPPDLRDTTAPAWLSMNLNLSRDRAAVMDRPVRRLFSPFASDSLAVAALGGYGRGELAPGSDVDLLFVHRPGEDTGAAAMLMEVLYPLWDAGVKVSHAVRTPEECGLQASERLESLTSMLDAHLLAGSPELFFQAREAAMAVIRRDRSRFLRELEVSRDVREDRFGRVHHSLQPDLKEALGGLRDADLRGWVDHLLLDSRARLLAADWSDLAEREAAAGRRLDPSSAPREGRVLMLVRTALHRVAGSGSNRLVGEHHAAVAELLGLQPEETWESRDVLVRLVIDQARALDSGAAAAIRGAARAVGADWAIPMRAPSPDRPLGEELMASFAQVARGDLSPLDSIAEMEPAGSVGELNWSPDLLRSFLSMVEAGRAGWQALELMDAAGLVSKYLPEWEGVRGRPQRDPYHRYPVDVHLLATAAEVARLLQDPDEPFAEQAAQQVRDGGALLLGGLLHDIGKVGLGSHVSRGQEIAGRVLDRMGVVGERSEVVLFLVREHLLLSDTATRRNIEDEDLVLHVAARVGDQERLAALYLLTIADAHATGPNAVTPWRMALVRDLVSKVSRVFDRGLMDPGRAGRLERAEERVRQAMLAAGRTGSEVEGFLRDVPPAYLLWARGADAPAHFDLVTPTPGPNESRVHVGPGRASGTYLLVVAARDRLGLLASISGALSLAGLSILTAQAFTTETGVALDAFEVRGAFEEEVAGERWARFRHALEEALEGRADTGTRIRALRAHYRAAPTGIPATIRVDHGASDFYTVVEVGGADRLGLLFDLTSTFAELGVDVHLAKVATYGPRVIDAFYVTDSTGQKLAAEGEEALRLALLEAVAPSPLDEPDES